MFSSLSALAVAFILGQPLPMEAFGCDEAQQALDIVSAHQKDGWEAGSVVAKTHTNTKNELGEPICGKMQVIAIPLEVVWKGTLTFPSGDENVSIVHITQASTGRDFYVLTIGADFIKAGLTI